MTDIPIAHQEYRLYFYDVFRRGQVWQNWHWDIGSLRMLICRVFEPDFMPELFQHITLFDPIMLDDFEKEEMS